MPLDCILDLDLVVYSYTKGLNWADSTVVSAYTNGPRETENDTINERY